MFIHAVSLPSYLSLETKHHITDPACVLPVLLLASVILLCVCSDGKDKELLPHVCLFRNGSEGNKATWQ